ncbi:MAG: ribonuclease H-like domain-containing protein [Treponema sp.]|nr:ribonuclease H-like domain-containing protein [Treponema sp.]
MPHNLRARLERIRNTTVNHRNSFNNSNSGKDDTAEKITSLYNKVDRQGSCWQEAGYKVMSRTLTFPLALPAALPETLSRVLPDLAKNKPYTTDLLPEPDRFLFFDLETTGLSGGAGTVAFLAAFGRFVRSKSTRKCYDNLEITQYLLLDYPGENDFLENILSVISSSGNPCFLSTYNGKAFDTPLLKTRCLMNGLALPRFLQLDLLHPSRRLWKRIISSCSQTNVETQVLGLDRTGDTPGAMAPDIWFNFLRSGEEFAETGKSSRACQALLGICDHNVKDIFGLASLFTIFAKIAESPLDAAGSFRCDEENLAMCFRRHAADEKTAGLLLEAAAKNYPRSCLRLGFYYFRQCRYEEGRTVLKQLVNPAVSWKVSCSITVQAMALRSLAIDADRRLGRKDTALDYLEKAASMSPLPGGLKTDLLKRQEKLQSTRQIWHRKSAL